MTRSNLAPREDSPATSPNPSGSEVMPAMSRRSLPYGLWPSPISPARMASGLSLSSPTWDGDGRTLLWLEGRSGHGVLVTQGAGEAAARDLTAGHSVRARVGYGGGDFTVHSGIAYYAAEGRLWRQPLAGGQARPITPAFGQPAAPTVSPDGRQVAFVHSYERQDVIALVDSDGRNWPRRLVAGEDFYMQPAWHPDGRRLAYICWNHPHMPWDGTWLRMVDVESGDVQTLAGGEPGDPAILQPTFSPDGRLLAYASDATGWWNVYVRDLATGATRQLTHDADAEAGGRTAWAQGLRTLAFAADGQSIFYLRDHQGSSALWRAAATGGEPQRVPIADYNSFGDLAAAATGGRLAVVASSPARPACVLAVDAPATDRPRVTVMRRSAPETVPAGDLAAPQSISWPTEGGSTVHGLYYPPTSPDCTSPGRPPVIVRVHGGPTGATMAGYSAPAQFFATRGYAVLEVNYRGSSGYGRAYRDALRGNWGVYDVEDAMSGARHLAERGLCDPEKCVVMGGSAGGYTVLRALSTHPGFFKAGVCLYGVSNLFTLAAETHKFEERYLDSMIGPLPEASAVYRERSPIFAADRIVDPIAVYQGEEDVVVPRNQADTIVESLERRGVPYIYEVYPGEGHGWRKAETVEAFYRSVEAFLRQWVIFA